MNNESKPMCRAGCGFHADPATDGLCSLCFNKTLAPNCQPRHAAKSFSNPSSCLNRGPFESNMAVALVEAERHELLLDSPNSNAQPTKKNYVVDLQINLKSNESNEHINKSVGNPSPISIPIPIPIPILNRNPNPNQMCGNDVMNCKGDKNAASEKHSVVRCAAKNCRRKLRLTDFQCRCGRCFCPLHRYSDRHECTFNYREWGASEIQRKNPRVVGEKIRKI